MELVSEFEDNTFPAHQHPQWCQWIAEFNAFQEVCWEWQRQVKRQQKEIAQLRQVNEACMMKGARVALHYERKQNELVANFEFEHAVLATELKKARRKIRELEEEKLRNSRSPLNEEAPEIGVVADGLLVSNDIIEDDESSNTGVLRKTLAVSTSKQLVSP